MATLSPMRSAWPIISDLEILSRGKVRDTYKIENGHLLSLATDGISIFDFVLNATVPMKGTILNCMNHFWTEYLKQFDIPTHLVASGAGIDEWLPQNLRGNPDLQSRASIIRKLEMAPVEFIYRAVLTGSSVSSYKKTGAVCEHRLPSDLQDGDPLPFVLDTPTTKAEEGHDENISFRQAREQWPQQTMIGLQVFQACSSYCESRGVKLADTKFEFGANGIIADEICTPDSSRFWEFKAWQEGHKLETRKAPPPYDKQFVRAWGIENGVNKRDPKKPEEVERVHGLEVPQKVIEQTTKIYRYIFWRLTGITIERYLREKMGVSVDVPAPRIAIICGSESDLPTVNSALLGIPGWLAKIKISVISCHRNPEKLEDFILGSMQDFNAVICAGGKALALPGVVDALAHANQIDTPVIGVALGEPGSRSLLAAQLSIEELPSTPVIMDEITGVYTGTSGLRSAIYRVIYGELPPPKTRTEKPAQINILQT